MFRIIFEPLLLSQTILNWSNILLKVRNLCAMKYLKGKKDS